MMNQKMTGENKTMSKHIMTQFIKIWNYESIEYIKRKWICEVWIALKQCIFIATKFLKNIVKGPKHQ